MPGFYSQVFERLPQFLRRRIHPLDFAIDSFVRSANSLQRGAWVLDAGAGESRFARHFGRQRYLAIDTGVGDQDWDYSRIDVRADLGAMPIASGRMQAVINTQVLEHVPDPGGVLGEIHRVLEPGGSLYLTAPQGWHEHQQPHDFYRFTRYSLRRLLEETGFREIEIEPMGGYFHYLGHRLTYIPKILFADRRGVLRALLFPFELAALGIFCLLLPIVCYYLDPLDRKKEFTLGYRCRAVK